MPVVAYQQIFCHLDIILTHAIGKQGSGSHNLSATTISLKLYVLGLSLAFSFYSLQ